MKNCLVTGNMYLHVNPFFPGQGHSSLWWQWPLQQVKVVIKVISIFKVFKVKVIFWVTFQIPCELSFQLTW